MRSYSRQGQEMSTTAHLKLVTPNTEKRAVGPRRKPNAEYRSREHLTEAEVEKLLEAAKGNRHGHRDYTMVLVAYRHGLRVSELVDLRWNQIDFDAATLHVRRAKQGIPSTHPILGDAAGLTPATARAGAEVGLRIHVRAWGTVCQPRLSSPDRTLRRGCQTGDQGAPAHAAARLWLCPGQSGPRHAGPAVLSR